MRVASPAVLNISHFNVPEKMGSCARPKKRVFSAARNPPRNLPRKAWMLGKTYFASLTMPATADDSVASLL